VPLELMEETKNTRGAQRARVIKAYVLTGLPGRKPIYLRPDDGSLIGAETCRLYRCNLVNK
jgi:hypothetical protein